MDQSERAEWHYNQNARIARIAAEMGKLFTPGHNASQSASYESTRQEYLQALTDKQWYDWSDDKVARDHTTCG